MISDKLIAGSQDTWLGNLRKRLKILREKLGRSEQYNEALGSWVNTLSPEQRRVFEKWYMEVYNNNTRKLREEDVEKKRLQNNRDTFAPNGVWDYGLDPDTLYPRKHEKLKYRSRGSGWRM